VLLIGAGLLFRTFAALGRVDPGFQARGVLTMNTALSYPKLTGARRYATFYENFVEGLARIPGVTAAGASSSLPWNGAADNALFGIEGRPRPENASMHAHYEFVSPDYLRAIGVPLVAGCWLAASDHFDAPKVVLVNQALAEAPMTIVGVAGDVRDGPTGAQAQPAMDEPFLQNPSFGNYVALRATRDLQAIIPAAREVARRMGNDLSIQEIRPMEQVLAAAVATRRFALDMIGVFAAVALALALVGVYGVISYTAGRRTREVAIRTALGAGPADTLRLLLAPGLRLILGGIVVGALAAAALTRFLSALLYQVSPTDPFTFACVAGILAAVALAAAFAPARKALRIDPIRVLRHE
jgi:hypothetical protein